MTEAPTFPQETLKQHPITVMEWEAMSGEQMRKFLKPLSQKERLQFIVAASGEYVDLPWKERRKLKMQKIQETEAKLHLPLTAKIDLAFTKGSMRVRDWLHDHFSKNKQEPSVLKFPKSPYLIPPTKG